MKVNWVLVGISILATVIFSFLYFKTATQYSEYRAQVNNAVKDPGSTEFKNEYVSTGEIYCAEVNSKNSYGAFVGFERVMATGGKYAYAFFERDGLDGHSVIFDTDILVAELQAKNNAKERELAGGGEATLSENEYKKNAVREVFEREWSENCSLESS